MNADAVQGDGRRPTATARRCASSELGKIVDGVEDQRTASWFYTPDGEQRAITLGIQRQPGTNTIAVADAVKALLPQFRAELPASVHMDVLYDRSDTIRESYRDVQFTMLLTLALVIMVIFVFLRNVWATVIPSLALPFSIIGTFAVMYMLGYSLDNLSMMALILSVGFVVDDAIVMLENIYRHVEMGEDPLTASLVGSREIGFTIVSMTLSLAAVFIPVLFMGGVLGRLFREFSVTICVAILISGVVSVTLTPMLCSRFLKKPTSARRRRRVRPRHRARVPMAAARLRPHAADRAPPPAGDDGGVRRRAGADGAACSCSCRRASFPIRTPTRLRSSPKRRRARRSTSWSNIRTAVADIIRRDPERRGAGLDDRRQRGGDARRTEPRADRRAPQAARRPAGAGDRHHRAAAAADRDGARHRGLHAEPADGPDRRPGEQEPVSVLDAVARSRAAVRHGSRKLRKALADVPGLEDLTSDLEVTSPQVDVDIDRDKAAALGVTASQIENAFYDAYGPRWVSTIYAPVNEYKVLLELAPQFQADPTALSLLYFKARHRRAQRAAVGAARLRSRARAAQTIGPQTVNHYGQLTAVTISFGLAPGASLGYGADPRARGRRRARCPKSVTGQFQGAAKAFQSSLVESAPCCSLIAVMVVYIVLGILYESYIHPLTILSGLPSAGFGALVTLIVFRMDLNIYAFVGMIMLIGIVEKNAIMQIDFALDAERGGMTPEQAIYQGCLIRFRPIMMTTMAALLGAVPIALGYGAGGEARQPLGLVVVGGLLFSQLVTLYLTPVFYTYMAQVQAWLRGGAAQHAGGTTLLSSGSFAASPLDPVPQPPAAITFQPRLLWRAPPAATSRCRVTHKQTSCVEASYLS